MGSFGALQPIYLDQNVYSRLQDDSPERVDLLRALLAIAQNNGIFVYSSVHVDECRASDRPEAFASILEELSAYFLESSDPSRSEFILTSGKARDLILAETDFLHETSRRMEDMLKPLQFAFGWLDKIDADELLSEIVSELDAFWASLAADLPATAHDALQMVKDAMAREIFDIPLQKLQEENLVWRSKLRTRLPQNYAQLDEIPASEIVPFVFSHLDASERKEIEQQFPQGFWVEPENRKAGALTGLAFLLFAMGIVRNKRVRKKDRKTREKHFLGQFRDCQHIEEGAGCAMFLTFDEGAARLAKAVYSYSGVQTIVRHLPPQTQ